jgi:inosine/xanthosine triphosphate pyrophosphatase family protein
MKILLATNNLGKVERFKKLLEFVDSELEVFTPKELGIEVLDVEETGETLLENAELKAEAYFGKVDMPILSNDTGFFVEGEGMVNAPKREALRGSDEHSLTKEEIAEKILSFWKGVATKHGGKVDAAWVESFVVLLPSGIKKTSESRREIVLTNTEFGKAHIQMPVRALYYSKTTGKPAIEHTEEEEILEMEPVIEALRKIL